MSVDDKWAWKNVNKARVDRPCLALCEVLNQLPGVRTSSSCCGHTIRQFAIGFAVDTVESLSPIALWADGHDPGLSRWRIEVLSAGLSGVGFAIVCPPGPSTYSEADRLARLISEEVSKAAPPQKGAPA